MAEASASGGIRGALPLSADELRAASREAVRSETRRLGVLLLALVLGAVCLTRNIVEGTGALGWFVSACTILPALWSLATGRRERARKLRVTLERLAQTPPEHARYVLDDAGLTIMRQDAPMRLLWSQCHGYEEAEHTFQLYFDRQLPELVLKRAFAPEDLPALRALLARRISPSMVGRRAMGRAFGIAMAMGILILVLGIGVGVFVGR